MKLFVAGLPLDVSEDRLLSIFSKYGTLISAKIVYNKEANVSKGYGFVDFIQPEDAETAIKEINQTVMEQKVITVRIADIQPL